jgi:hypothetical protein
LLDKAVFDAYASGTISTEAVVALADMRNFKDRNTLIDKLKDGKTFSAKDVKSYNKAAQGAALSTAMASQPELIEFAENPLQQAIDLLENPTAKNVKRALGLLKLLLEG